MSPLCDSARAKIVWLARADTITNPIYNLYSRGFDVLIISNTLFQNKGGIKAARSSDCD